MSIAMKALFLFIAVITIVCFAIASILMADGNPWGALGVFVLAFVLTSVGFVTRKRILGKTASL